jgi:hypothetical protein
MAMFVVNDRMIDWIIGLVVVEAAIVLIWRARSGRGPAPAAFICNLFAGAFLLLAVRGALSGAHSALIGVFLLAALIAHLFDLAGRWERSGSPASNDVRSSIRT